MFEGWGCIQVDPFSIINPAEKLKKNIPSDEPGLVFHVHVVHVETMIYPSDLDVRSSGGYTAFPEFPTFSTIELQKDGGCLAFPRTSVSGAGIPFLFAQSTSLGLLSLIQAVMPHWFTTLCKGGFESHQMSVFEQTLISVRRE